MAQGTTLLSYEMGWQLRLFDLAAASQQSNDYISAVNYGIAFLTILGLADKIPKKKIPEKKGTAEEIASYRDYYFEIIMSGLNQISNTINSVRNDPKYNKAKDIPDYRRPRVEAN